MKKNIVETEVVNTVNPTADVPGFYVESSSDTLGTEKEFVNPAFPREIYDRAIDAKEDLEKVFGESELNPREEAYDSIMNTLNDMHDDAKIAASCGEFTYNFGHGWEFKMPSTRDIMARLQKADENPDLRYTIRFSQTVSHHKDQFGTMTEKLVRYFYIRKFGKEEHNGD